MLRTRRTRLLGVAGLVLALALTGCSKSDEPEKPRIPASFNFLGEVRLSGPANVTGDLSRCSGVGPYVDMYRGAIVVVTDLDGKPLARGAVTSGLGTNYYQEVLDECAFRFRVVNVPRAKGYFVVIARQPARPISLAWVTATSGVIRFDANPPNVRPIAGGP